SLLEAAVDDVRIVAAFGPAVDADVAILSPPRLELAQNRPNPGGPGTQIGYALPEPSRVRLTIYDVRGRAVRRLVSGHRPAGPGLVRWDGRDATGQRVAPGVYFYRLTAPAGSLTRKMTVAP
ncbi:MAG TPA: FlgD immunoglobulin-like domain containing protein, partial [bacterium]|nr:FlgD immunoglobulin-like domain containing protein [bacterium]